MHQHGLRMPPGQPLLLVVAAPETPKGVWHLSSVKRKEAIGDAARAQAVGARLRRSRQRGGAGWSELGRMTRTNREVYSLDAGCTEGPDGLLFNAVCLKEKEGGATCSQALMFSEAGLIGCWPQPTMSQQGIAAPGITARSGDQRGDGAEPQAGRHGQPDAHRPDLRVDPMGEPQPGQRDHPQPEGLEDQPGCLRGPQAHQQGFVRRRMRHWRAGRPPGLGRRSRAFDIAHLLRSHGRLA